MKIKLFTIAMMVAFIMTAMTKVQAQNFEGPCLPSMHGLDDHQSAFCGSTVTQTIALSAGTNWFSTYLEITKEDLQNALLDVLSNPTGAIIKSQDGNSTYRGGRWRDQNFVWDVAKMYMIVAPEDCEIALTGEPINPADHPITIAPNAPTWIGFPFDESKTPAQVIPAGFAVNGDIIKGMGGNIRYNNGSWRAQGMNSLEPGKGYIYNSKSAVSRTLIFPSSAK